MYILVGNSDSDIDTRNHVVSSDTLDDLDRGLNVDQTLVNAHLIGIPGLRTLTIRSFTGGDLENLGGETDGALGVKLSLLGTGDDVVRDGLNALNVSRGDGDADLHDRVLDILNFVCLLAHCVGSLALGEYQEWCFVSRLENVPYEISNGNQALAIIYPADLEVGGVDGGERVWTHILQSRITAQSPPVLPKHRTSWVTWDH